jgi:hypothetical protein
MYLFIHAYVSGIETTMMMMMMTMMTTTMMMMMMMMLLMRFLLSLNRTENRERNVKGIQAIMPIVEEEKFDRI